MGLIDTHAHLTFPDFDPDRDEVTRRAWDAGLQGIILVGAGGGGDGNQRAIDLAKTDDRFRVIVGHHPHDAGKVNGNWVGELDRLASDQRVVGIGEIGLDYHYPEPSKEIQHSCFCQQVQLASKLDLPIAIHDREAHEDIWRILEKVGVPKRGGIFHCFSGDVAFAKKVIAAGFYISIPGIVTFRKSGFLREVVQEIPLEKLVIETDCPYLSPDPHRGKRNEPSFVVAVARKIAEIKNLSFSEVTEVTTANARQVFNLR